MTSHLRLRKEHYYFRLRVPADLLSIIPETELLKSLRTKDRRTAGAVGSRLYSQAVEIFTLTRAGFISSAQATERICAILERNQPARPKALNGIVTTPPPTEKPSPTLSMVIKTYKQDKEAGWTGKTRIEYKSYFRLIHDVMGDVDVTTIDRNKVRKLRDNLTRLPASLYKKYPGKAIEQVLAVEGITPMSTTTVNKLLTLFGGLMRHCIGEGFIKSNPLDGMKVPNKRRPDEERKAYSTDDLKKIVAALPSPANKPERYWIPLIGMLSGMRLGEICGLHVEDVKQVDGIWCFSVNGEDDKRLKTLSSKRVIPLHPFLIQLGFLAFVDSMRGKGQPRMWPNLKRRETDGYCHAIGKWYQRFNRKHITTDPLKTFHSLRHTFANTLKQQGEQEALISELMGHANASITTGRYGKRYKAHGLLEAVCKLDYGLGVFCRFSQLPLRNH